MNDLLGPIIENVVAGLLGSAIIFAGGFLVGRYRERRRARGRNLEDYDFYPFAVDRDNFRSSILGLSTGRDHFLQNSDATAARQLIFIGEQNEVRHQLDRDRCPTTSDLCRVRRRADRRRKQRVPRELQAHRAAHRPHSRDMGIEGAAQPLNPAKSIARSRAAP